MTYPYPTNITNMTDFTRYTNNLTGGWFGTGIMIMWFVISFTVLFQVSGNPKKAFAGSTFFTTMLSFLFYAIGLVEVNIPIMGVVLTAGSALLLFYDR